MKAARESRWLHTGPGLTDKEVSAMRHRTTDCFTCDASVKTERASGRVQCSDCRHADKAAGVRHCTECFAEYAWGKQSRCSPCRYERAKTLAARSGKFCEYCGKPATHGEYCANHYSQQRRAAGYVPNVYPHKVYARECAFCGGKFETQSSRTKCCSQQCGAHLHNGRSNSKEVALHRSPERVVRMWHGHRVSSSRAPFVSYSCAWCGEQFLSQYAGKYCSDGCSTRASWKRRYDRCGEFYISKVSRQAIYERDGWMCQLCGDPVPPDVDVMDNLAATLDHIVPQSLQLVPDHSPGNLRLAHRVCNVRRSNHMEYEHLFA